MSVAVHATAVAIDGHGVLLTGKSGSGKSDLALRLMDRGARLVGDDYLNVVNGTAFPVEALAGKIEVHGIGICSVDFAPSAPLRLLVELGENGERAPASWPLAEIAGYAVPKLRLDAFAASAPIKVEWALKRIVDAGLLPVSVDAT